jgi:hypothetical protein
MAQGLQKVDYSDYKSDQNPYGIQPEVVTDEQDIVETLCRENDYMDNLLQKVKDIFKIDREAALIDLEIYLTRLRE